MADAGKMGRNSTTGSALMILLLIVAIAAIGVFLAMNPGILENILWAVVIVAIIIVAAIAIIYFVMAILALPYYAMKGEEYQVDATYDLDDVKPVKEKDSEKDE